VVYSKASDIPPGNEIEEEAVDMIEDLPPVNPK